MKTNTGFTLIELSIVMIIISLIVGGIVGGKSLIRSAKVNESVQNFNKITTLVNSFTLQFDSFPGDLRDAASYWPECVDMASVKCNGDGDGELEQFGVPPLENGMFQLYHSKLADSMSFHSTGGGTHYIYDGFFSYSLNDGSGFYVGRGGGKRIEAFITPFNFSSVQNEGGMAAREILSIDRKLDDGLADKGSFRAAIDEDTNGCATGLVDEAVSSYDLDVKDTINCFVFFWL